MNDNSAYAAEQQAKLDAKITELRAEGWDVIARSERDKALMERDEARDEVEELKRDLAHANKEITFLVEGDEDDRA